MAPHNPNDGRCVYSGCKSFCDFTRHDKPPRGWATISVNRYTAKGGVTHSTLLVCPAHSVALSHRQARLPDLERTGLTRAFIVSPYAGDIETNLQYLRDAMRDALDLGFAPFAPHGLYTQPGVLDDNKPDERRLGILAGHEWMSACDKVLVYSDLGLSAGMAADIHYATERGLSLTYRSLKRWKNRKPAKRATASDPKPLYRAGSASDAT